MGALMRERHFEIYWQVLVEKSPSERRLLQFPGVMVKNKKDCYNHPSLKGYDNLQGRIYRRG
jgi:hypothetical protein